MSPTVQQIYLPGAPTVDWRPQGNQPITVAEALALGEVDAFFPLAVAEAADISVETALNVPLAEALALSDVTVTLGLTHNRALALQALAGPILAAKDTWVDNVNLCPTDVVRNGSDLQVDGTIATRKDAYLGWDLSGIAATWVITAAKLTLNWKALPAVAGQQFAINGLTNAADQGWAEATYKCSLDQKALTLLHSELFAGAVGDQDVVLNAAAIAHLQGRLGAVATLVITVFPLGLSATAQSKDSGGAPGNASGPRLTLTMTG